MPSIRDFIAKENYLCACQHTYCMKDKEVKVIYLVSSVGRRVIPVIIKNNVKIEELVAHLEVLLNERKNVLYPA